MSAGLKLVWFDGELTGETKLKRYPVDNSQNSIGLTTFMGITSIHPDVLALSGGNNSPKPQIKFESRTNARGKSTELVQGSICSLPEPVESNAAAIQAHFTTGASSTAALCAKMGYLNIASGANEIDVDITLFNVSVEPTEDTTGEDVEICKVRFFTFSSGSTSGTGFLPLPADASGVFHTHSVFLTADGTIYLDLDPCPLGKTFGSGENPTIGGKAKCIEGVENHCLVTTYSSLVTRFGADPLTTLNNFDPKRVIKVMIRTSDPEYPSGWSNAGESCDKNYYQCYKIMKAASTQTSGRTPVSEEAGGPEPIVDVRWASGNRTCDKCGPEGGAKLAGIGTKSLIEHGFGENIRVLSATHFSTLEDGETEEVAWKRITMAGDTNLQIGAIPGGSTSTGAGHKARYVPRNTTWLNVVDLEAMMEVTRTHSWSVYETWQQTIEVIGDYDFDSETYKNVSINGLDLSMKKLFLESAMSTTAHMKLGATFNENFKVGFAMTTSVDEKTGEIMPMNASASMSMSQVLDAIGLVNNAGVPADKQWKDNVSVKFNLGGEFFQGGADATAKEGSDGNTWNEKLALIGNEKLYVKDMKVDYKLHIPNGLGLGGAMTYTINTSITPEGINPSLKFHWQKTDALSFKADFDESGVTALGVSYNPVLMGTKKEDRILGATVKELRLNTGLVWKAGKGDASGSMQPNMMLKYNFGDMVTIDADLLTGQASFTLKQQLLNIDKKNADGSTDYSMSATAWLEADSDLSDGWFTAGVDFRMEKALTAKHKVFGRVVAFAEAGVSINVGGGGPTSTAITSTGFRFFAGGKIGLEWKNNIFEYLGFPFNINFAPSLGFAIDLTYGVCSSYGTCAGFSGGAAFAVNLGITAFQFEWVDGLRAELRRKHKSVFRYIPFLGPVLARLPIISILGPKENIMEYVERAGPHRAVNVFSGCAQQWEESLVSYRKSQPYLDAPSRCVAGQATCKRDLVTNWHLANPFCDVVTRCFDDRRIKGYQNSWVTEYFAIDCSAGCDRSVNAGDPEDTITHSLFLNKLAQTEQQVYDQMIIGEPANLETTGLMNVLKKWTGWNLAKNYIVGLFKDPAVKDCRISAGILNEECFKAYKRYIDFTTGFAAGDTGHTCSPGAGNGDCDPSVGPFGRPWTNAQVTDFIGRTALWEFEDNIKEANVGKDHNMYKTWKWSGVECKFCIQKIWHMFLQSMQCKNNPHILRAQALFDARFTAMAGQDGIDGTCKGTDVYAAMQAILSEHSSDKARVYGMRSLLTDNKSSVMNILANPILRSPVWSTNSTWSAVNPGNKAIILDGTHGHTQLIAGHWGVQGQSNVVIPMYANMAEIHDDLQRLVCWGRNSAGQNDVSSYKLTSRYYAARRAVTYVKILAEQGISIGLDLVQSKAMGEGMAWANTGMAYLRQALQALYQTVDPKCDSSYSNDGKCADSLASGGRGFIVRDSDGANGIVEGSSESDRLAQQYIRLQPGWGVPYRSAGAITYRDINNLVLKKTFGMIPLSFVFYGKFDGDTSSSDDALLTRISTKSKTYDPNWTVSAVNQQIREKFKRECDLLTGSDRKSRRCKAYRKNGNRVEDKYLTEREETTCFPHGRSGSGAQWFLGMGGCCDAQQTEWMNFWCGGGYSNFRTGVCGWETCQWKDMYSASGFPNPNDSPAWPNVGGQSNVDCDP